MDSSNDTMTWTMTKQEIDSNYRSIVTPINQIAIPILLVFCAMAISVNIFIVIAVLCSRRRSSFNITLSLTISLAGVDAWSSVTVALGLFFNSYATYVLNWSYPQWANCSRLALEFLRLGSLLTLIMHILTLASTQYMAGNRPHVYRRFTDRKPNGLVNMALLILWMGPPVFYCVAYSTRIFLTQNFLNNRTHDQITVSAVCSDKFLSDLAARSFICCSVASPLMAIIVIYVRLRILAKIEDSSLRRANRRIKTTMILVLIFVLSWIPNIILYWMTCEDYCWFSSSYMKQHSPRFLIFSSLLGNFLMIAKGLLTPFIYAGAMREIRHAIPCTVCRNVLSCCAKTIQEYGETDRSSITNQATNLRSRNDDVVYDDDDDGGMNHGLISIVADDSISQIDRSTSMTERIIISPF